VEYSIPNFGNDPIALSSLHADFGKILKSEWVGSASRQTTATVMLSSKLLHHGATWGPISESAEGILQTAMTKAVRIATNCSNYERGIVVFRVVVV